MRKVILVAVVPLLQGCVAAGLAGYTFVDAVAELSPWSQASKEKAVREACYEKFFMKHPDGTISFRDKDQLSDPVKREEYFSCGKSNQEESSN